jgi:hypothetical protein
MRRLYPYLFHLCSLFIIHFRLDDDPPIRVTAFDGAGQQRHTCEAQSQPAYGRFPNKPPNLLLLLRFTMIILFLYLIEFQIVLVSINDAKYGKKMTYHAPKAFFLWPLLNGS